MCEPEIPQLRGSTTLFRHAGMFLAGIQSFWIPAFAGMTKLGNFCVRTQKEIYLALGMFGN